MTRIIGRLRPLSTAFGVLMAAAAGIHTAGFVLILAILAALLVLVGIAVRRAGTLAVLLAGAAVLLADAEPLAAGLAGLGGVCYLVLRHTETGSTATMRASAPAMVAALGFTCVGVLAASFPLDLPWLPVLAPPAVFAAYLLATRPLYAGAAGDQRARR